MGTFVRVNVKWKGGFCVDELDMCKIEIDGIV